MSGEWNQVPGMRGVRVARIEDGEGDVSAGVAGLSRSLHTLLRLTIEPGSEVEPLGDVHAINLHVQDGALRIAVSEGDASVGIASGEPIRSGDADIVFCDKGKRRLLIGESAILGAGNSFTIRDGVMHMEAVGDTPAELQMSVIKNVPQDPRDQGDTGPITMNLCWVCPFT